jgi:hypothetical protein
VSTLVLEVVKYALSLLTGALLYGLWESRRGLRFDSSAWTFKFSKIDTVGAPYYDEIPPSDRASLSPARYSFYFRIFNEKSEATGLHKFSVEFTKGPKHDTTILLTDTSPIKPTGYVYSPGARIPPLSEIQLPSRAWATESVAGFIKWTPALQEADAVWLIAHTPRGRKFRWRVAPLRSMKAIVDTPHLSLEG